MFYFIYRYEIKHVNITCINDSEVSDVTDIVLKVLPLFILMSDLVPETDYHRQAYSC